MKFGSHFAQSISDDWRVSAVDYDKVKLFLRSNTKNARWNELLEAKFIQMLELELKKVRAIHGGVRSTIYWV